jgi:hypothetical protein
MIELDTSQLAPEITYVLMLRGAQVPALAWADRANDAAKRHLESMDDLSLLGRPTLANPDQGLAVRALLYLWNGWLKECADTARAVPDPERPYLVGLCHRHAGHLAEAKAVHRAMGTHPICGPLARYAIDTIGLMGVAQDKALARFRQILELDGVWEPASFIDLYDMARTEKLDRINLEVIRMVQCREWELLFGHCYESAVGEPLVKKLTAPSPDLDRKRRLEKQTRDAKERSRKYTLDELQRQKLQPAAPPRPKPAKPKATEPAVPRKPPVPSVGVVCPACGHGQRVAESLRGKPTRCGRCGVSYRVPVGKPVSPGADNR